MKAKSKKQAAGITFSTATLIQDWPGLFQLWKSEGGTIRAEMSPDLRARMAKIRKHAQPPNEDKLVAHDLLLLAGKSEPCHALASLVAYVREAPADKRREAAQIAKDVLCNAVDMLSNLSVTKQDPRKMLVHLPAGWITENVFEPVPLAYIAILATHRLVEKRHRLPSKREVRELIEADFPQVRDHKESLWTKVFRDAGLTDKLSRKDTW